MVSDRTLARHRVLSLDVFDTALLRRCAAPTDVHALVAAAYREERPDAPAWDYVAARIEAEEAARRRAFSRWRAEEIRFDEIFRMLAPPAGWEAARLAALELEVEERVALCHEPVRELAERAAARGLRVIFTSDMYLPAPFVRRLLEGAGYTVGELLVSSELGRTKSSGSLYRVLLDRLGVKPGEVLHVGDNFQSDTVMAARLGLSVHHVEKRGVRAAALAPRGRSRDPAAALHRGLAERRLTDGAPLSFWERLGWVQAAPLYLGFAQWLADALRTRGYQRVYFLARDGHVMRRVFRRVAPDVDARYLYGSRRAFNLPAIERVDAGALRFLESGTARMQVRHYLERIRLDAGAHEGAIRAAGFRGPEAEVRRGEGPELEQLRALFRALAPAIVEVARRERALLVEYLAQEGFFDGPRAAVVDLGWHGTLQESLARVVALDGRSLEIEGFYLATFEAARARHDSGQTMHAFVCENGRPLERLRVFQACCEIVELLHAAPHGTTLGYHRRGGRIEPELAPYEGTPAQLDAAMAVEGAALAAIEALLADWATTGSRPLPRFTADGALSELARLLEEPTPDEARHLGDVLHADDFGGVLLSRPLAQPPALATLLTDPGRGWAGYDEAYWKEGYVTRLWGTSAATRRLLQKGFWFAERRPWARKLIGR